MITLSMINQYAMDNSLGDDTDIFTILSQMQLEYKKGNLRSVSTPFSTPPTSETNTFNLVEYTTQDVLDLFNS
jgi:hypothetical protein